MGLERLLTLQKPVYATATYQFLSSLEATHRSREDPEDGYGFITFKIGRQDYRMSFKQISEVMGFPDRRDPRIEGTKDDPELLWYMIGAGVYNTKLIKGADIRNPSIRYVQRILASTFYARKDPGRIVEDELHFLTWCLKDVIGEMFDDGNEVRFGIRTQPGIVGILVKRLLHYQDWAWTKKDKEPRLSIEGLITPLLEAMVVPLPEADKGYALMDEPFLTNIGFLDGQVGNSWVYRFKVVKQEGKYVRTFLPNQSLTSISKRNNIKFRLPQEALYNSEIPKKISRSKKKQAIDDSQPEEQAEQGSSSSIYGSSRYYFPPYSGALPDGPLREAHQQIRTLQRGNKFQDRTIAKLVKSVNYLAKKLKNLTMRPRRSRASTLVTTDDPMEDDGTGVEEEPVHTHRHSYHGDASATEVYYEEPRASLREPRQRKPRRQRHPVTQLPPNDSGNETPYRLGLYDDVTIILGRMGLERLLTLQKLVYATATYQFLSSLEATHRSREDPEDGYVFITFKIGRQAYRMSFKQISEVMGFPDRRDPRIEGAKDDPELLWYMIGDPSKHFLCSERSGRIVEDELHFLTWGLKDVIGETFDDGSEAWTKKDKEPRLSIGGLITPLLEAMEVPLPEADKGYALMDEPFLPNIGFLDGQVGNSWVYRFKVVKQEGKYVRTFLPNQSLTSISERNNIKFRLPQEAFYNSEIHEIPKKISRSKKKQAIDDSQPEEQAEQGSSSSIYGSSRYYFPPYSGALPDGPLREAHQQIRTLQRGNKFQDRTIAKLFLSSLEATHRSREDPEDGYGFITFKTGRQAYRLSFKQISKVMGFPDRRDPRIEGAKDDPELLWYMIGAGVYNTKLIKGTDIRNPSIHYVQRILASTFYARKDPGRIVEDELQFLTWGLKDVIGETFDDGSEIKKDKEPRLSIGGLITPLLEAMEVHLPEADKGYALMDEPFLTNIGFLDGQVGNSWVYHFKVVKQEGKYVRTFLPNQSLTSISERNNIKFRIPQKTFYNSEIHEIPKKISRSKKKQAIDDSQPEEQAEQGSSSSIYGSSRY
ncbi:hypothetical protein F2Q70_00021313 [Brassica cretica]|uniref:Arabidopsis retrotransposon Orf1 C-terminal domain-containing protein n=1 Tax=Brassica cretica TaxID=69181 RepID=A0A8S9GT71_BRACR|nr:hypothetical protein F2Q70_00021313 [Brassica cretica]